MSKSKNSGSKGNKNSQKGGSKNGNSGSKNQSGGKKQNQSSRKRLQAVTPFLVVVAIIVGVIIVFTQVLPAITGSPKMRLIGPTSVETAQGEPYVDAGLTATEKGDDVSDQVYVIDDVDTSKLGTYEYTYNVDFNNRTYSVTRNVEVTDQTPPVITLEGDSPMIVDNIDDFVDPGATATDNCDGNVTRNITSELEQAEAYTWDVVYTVQDKAKNEGSAVREVIVRDDTPPEIVLKGEESMSIEEYTEFVDPGAEATDSRDGDITDSITTEGYVDIYRAGTYTLTYTATDSSGNEASVSRTVEVESVPTNDDHSIYLTFDDGPSTSITPQILDTLKENDIKATFFILDYTEDEIPILQRMIDEGHTIGIHGYSHEYSKIYTSVDECMDNITKLADKLYEDTGYQAFVTRFPGGSGNTASEQYCEGIMTQMARLVTEEGWIYMDWNVSGEDSVSEDVTASEITDNVEADLSESRSNVVLLHDYGGRQTTADALQPIIDYGKENGYHFYSITEETAPVHQAIEN